MVRACERCGVPFTVEPGQSWKRICLTCWRRKKQAEENEYEKEIDYWKKRALNAETRLERVYEEQDEDGELDLETLKKVRLLVHPDRHNQSRAANEICGVINRLIDRRKNQ